jgi:transposase
MTETTLAAVERALERATDLETEEAVAVLRTARQDVRDLASDPDVDEERRGALETQLERRIREVTERDAYDGGLGSAMNPADDDAP